MNESPVFYSWNHVIPEPTTLFQNVQYILNLHHILKVEGINTDVFYLWMMTYIYGFSDGA